MVSHIGKMALCPDVGPQLLCCFSSQIHGRGVDCRRYGDTAGEGSEVLADPSGFVLARVKHGKVKVTVIALL